MVDFKNKKITVFGLAKSGLAAAKKLALLEAKVFVSELRPAAQIDPQVIKSLEALKIDFELGGHSAKTVGSADLIVVSPGIHLDLPVFKEAKSKGVPIMSEIELAYRLLKKPMIY